MYQILKEDKDVIDDLVQDAFILALVSPKELKNPNRFWSNGLQV